MPLLGLPAEVLEEIIDLLVAEKASLHAISRTCRTLSLRACHHLLQTARVKRPAQAVNLITHLERPASRLHTFIRKLKVEYDSPLVPQILARLPGLREVALRQAPVASTLSWSKNRPDSLKEVEKLVLRMCTFHDVSHFRAFVARFPALRSLRLRGVRLRQRAHSASHQDALSYAIEEISIAQTELSVFRDWRPASTISLSISLHGSQSDDAYSALLRNLGSQLSVLSIKMPSVYHAGPVDNTITLPDLSSSTSLHQLKITNIAPIHAESLNHLLRTCAVGVLNKLSLELLDLDAEMPLPLPCSGLSSCGSPAKLEPLPAADRMTFWSSLDVLLTSSQFAGLEFVMLCAETPLFGSTVDALTYCLPLLHSRREPMNRS